MPVVVHQSDLQSYNYCPKRAWFERQPDAPPRQLSRTAYGTVIHAALQVLELALAEGASIDQASQRALQCFEYYWHPLHIEELTDPIPSDGWMMKDSYGSLLRAGRNSLNQYAILREGDPQEVLALEYDFHVPMRDEHGRETGIWLAGQVDKLAVRWKRSKAYLSIEDYKSGKPKWGLRYNIQGTVYAYASLQPEFWHGGTRQLTRIGGANAHYESRGFGPRSQQMQDRFADTARGFRWISLHNGDAKTSDGGFRAANDYARMREAVTELVRMDEANIHPLRIDGETCEWCPYRNVCGGGVNKNDGVPT